MNIFHAGKQRISFKFITKKTIFVIIIIIFVATIILYFVLASNPIIIYNCDKDIAITIISKESIENYGKDIYRSSILNPIFIYVSEFTVNGESSFSYDQLRIDYIPIVGFIGAKIMEYSVHDVPYIKTYYSR